MKNIIILKKTREKKKLSRNVANTIVQAKLAQASSFVNFARRYKWAINNIDLDEAKKLGLTGINRYWRRDGQVKMRLD